MKKLLWISALIALGTTLRAQEKIYGITREGGTQGGGTVFVIDTTGQNYTPLYNFARPEHTPDNNEVAEGPDGYLYGTVAAGGMGNAGAIIKTKKDGTGYESLHAFNTGIANDGKNPSGRITLAGGYLYGTTRQGGDNDLGTIFRIKTDGTGYSILYSFSLTSGHTPQSGVILAANGNLYGVTQEGGDNQQGTLFSIKTDGTTFAKLHSFNIAEEALPYGGLLQASDNALYGMAATREENSKGFIYTIDTNGTGYTSLYTFAAGADPHGSFIQLANGYLYAATSTFIFRIKPDGTDFSSLHTFNGFGGRTGIGRLSLASDNYLYGVTAEGGLLDGGVVYKMNPDGTGYTVISEFSSAGQNPSGSTYLGTDATLYGMTRQGGAGFSGVLYSCNTGTAQADIVHSFFAADPNGQSPAHIIAGPDHALYGATAEGGTFNAGVIFKVQADGTGYTTLYNFDGSALDGASPNGLLYASNGYLYGTTGGSGHMGKGTLFRLKPDGTAFEQIHSWQGSDGAKPTGGLVEWQNEIWIITAEGGNENAGTVFAIPLTDTDLHLVYEFSPSNGTDGSNPTGRLTTAADGNLYGITRNGGSHNKGALIRFTSATTAPETLFSFDINSGNLPTGSLVETPDGYLNGTTTAGSINGAGELFKIKKDGTGYTPIYAFYDPAGTEAIDQLITGSTGRLFGVTPTGGLNSAGLLYYTRINGANPGTLLDFAMGTGSAPQAIALMGAGPELEVAINDEPATNPGTKDFGSINVLTASEPTTITLKNTGTTDLILKGNPKIVLTGATADFVIDQSKLPATIAAGSNAIFTVTFKPQTVGTKTASILIATNDLDEGSFNINLKGTAIKQTQTITFTAPAPQTYGGANFTLQATSSANLPVTLTSADASIASISGKTVTIKKAGSVNITASQAGNDNVSAATAVTHTLVINKAAQSITFAALSNKVVNNAPFTLTATTTSSLPITFTSSNPAVATISGNTVTIVAVGQTSITASQAGNANYLAAPSVTQPLTIDEAVIAMGLPTEVVFGEITVGTTVQKFLEIKNTGNSPLEITDIITPPGFTLKADRIITLTAGTSVGVSIEFAPENAILYNAEATIVSNATTSANKVWLKGKGVPVTGINDPAIPTPHIYPNPGTGVYTISTTQTLTTENTHLITPQGAEASNAILQPVQKDTYRLDLNNNPPGIYLLLINANNKTQTYRILKQ